MKRDWSKTRIGKKGEPLANEFYALVKPWVEKHTRDPSLWPGDLAMIASEVVGEIADELGRYVRYHQRYTTELAKRRRTAR